MTTPTSGPLLAALLEAAGFDVVGVARGRRLGVSGGAGGRSRGLCCSTFSFPMSTGSASVSSCALDESARRSWSLTSSRSESIVPAVGSRASSARGFIAKAELSGSRRSPHSSTGPALGEGASRRAGSRPASRWGIAAELCVLQAPASSTRAAAWTCSSGWVLIGCGLLAWQRRGDSRVGPLLAATGVAWFLGSFTTAALYLHRWPAHTRAARVSQRPCLVRFRVARGGGGARLSRWGDRATRGKLPPR